jgi:hypothetical protein
MKIEELIPCPSIKFTFAYNAYKYVPKISGCYVLAAFDDNIIYIGLSNNLYKRFQQHLESHEKTGITQYGKAVWFYCLEFDANNLPKLERTWLNQYETIHGNKPILNNISSPLI